VVVVASCFFRSELFLVGCFVSVRMLPFSSLGNFTPKRLFQIFTKNKPANLAESKPLPDLSSIWSIFFVITVDLDFSFSKHVLCFTVVVVLLPLWFVKLGHGTVISGRIERGILNKAIMLLLGIFLLTL
jgi:hypothetical protein